MFAIVSVRQLFIVSNNHAIRLSSYTYLYFCLLYKLQLNKEPMVAFFKSQTIEETSNNLAIEETSHQDGEVSLN